LEKLKLKKKPPIMQKFFLCKISHCCRFFWKKEYCVKKIRFFINKIILGQVCHISIPLGMLAEQKLEGKRKRKTLFLTPKKTYHLKEVYWYSSSIFFINNS
jgi:hypothetical protein